MGTAVEDGLIRRNPCQIKNGGTVNTPERPTASVLDVFAIADASQPRYRALVLLGAFCGLRWGELVGLRRRDIDLDEGVIRVRGSVSELNSGTRIYKAPKSEAGKRSVAIPQSVLPAVVDHLRQFAESGADGRVSWARRGRLPAGTTSTGCGTRRAPRWESRACASMIFGTPATPWRPTPTPTRVS
ncbi:hypothetical protein [Streptomyces sp. SLBN-115]|uniref:hypothetical protein n=1 Tax=Streptomyces sp. SLBN-115 TaxID=2768453 RepID=UPI002E0EEB07